MLDYTSGIFDGNINLFSSMVGNDNKHKDTLFECIINVEF